MYLAVSNSWPKTELKLSFKLLPKINPIKAIFATLSNISNLDFNSD